MLNDENFDVRKVMADVEPEETSSHSKTDENEGNEPNPLPHEEGWTDYILSLVDENDIYITDNGKKYPTVAGLRKVISKFYNILSSTSRVANIYILNGDPYPTSTVEHTITVIAKDGDTETTWSGCGTVGPFNQKDNNLPYPTECAETKARGRAYTNLLGLNVCTKDEITASPLTTKSSDKITTAQIKKFETFCKTLSINAKKFATTSFNGKYKKIEDYSSADFWGMWDYLNKLQQNMHNKTLTDKEKGILDSVKD